MTRHDLDESMRRHPAGRGRKPSLRLVPTDADVLALNDYNAGVTRARRSYTETPSVTPLLVEQVQRGGVRSAMHAVGITDEKAARDWVGEFPPKRRNSCGTVRGRQMHHAFAEAPCDECLVVPFPWDAP